jgi:hypothetical protein
VTKKKLLGIVAAVLVALAGALGAGVTVGGSAAPVPCENAERIRALEVRDVERDKRLERIETKVDKLIERGR